MAPFSSSENQMLEELEFLYNDRAEIGEDCYKVKLESFGVTSLYDLLSKLSTKPWDRGKKSKAMCF